MTPQSLKDKVAFFRQLETLKRPDDDEDGATPDYELEQQRRSESRAFFRGRPTTAPEASSRPVVDSEPQKTQMRGPKRTSSAPVSGARLSSETIIESTPLLRNRSKRTQQSDMPTGSSFVEESPPPGSPHAPTPRRSKSTTNPSSASTATKASTTTSGIAKRKRNSTLGKVVPESEQIFKGLSFFYIPNDDVAPARKMRIARAREYGARWTKEIQEATHIVVDKALKYDNIRTILAPIAGIKSLILVNEVYPLDCIRFRNVLNPDQAQYSISGRPALQHARQTEPEHTNPHEPSQNSNKSLELKPRQTNPSKWDYVPPRSPPRSQASSQRSGGREVIQSESEANSGTSQGVWLDTSDIMVQSLQGVATDDKGRGLSGAPQPVPSGSAAAGLERDELSEYIEMMQEYKDLPLGEEEDDLQSVVASEDASSNSNSDQESEGEKSRKKQRLDMVQSSRRKNLSFEEKFACNQGGTKDSSIDTNPNSRTIEVLQSMCDYYSRIDDHWRTTSYRKAIATLKRQMTKVTTKEDAKRLPNIGDRLAQKIEEIVTTNRLKRLEYAQKEPMDEVLQRFLNVYDVGLSRANKWISQGYRTLQDLLDRADLTPNQRVGVVHYDDLNSRIPRREVEALGAHVRKRAAKIDKDIELLIGGSFRRGADTSGDIDFIVTKKGTDSTADLVPFLQELISVLRGEDFLVATLASLHSHRRSKEGPGSKWHGCCVLPRIPGGFNDSDTYRPVWRRVDFLLVPETEYGAALIYFTGNDIFNRSMRLLASKKGMRLNQRGLYKEVMRGNNRVKVTEGELVEGRDERHIFEILGVKWREPRDRWC